MPDALWDFSRSRAVLIGVGAYTHLPPVGAALNSLARFTSVLTGPLCGWPADRISVISDVRQPGDLPDRLVELFEPIRDVALFYYVGHGQVDPSDTLCLGLVDSRKEATRRRTTSLSFDVVRHALGSSRAQTKIVILDCCYAGQAVGDPGSLAAPDLLDHTRKTGAYTLAAAEQFATAWYDTETTTTPQTYFTQYLADVIEAGITGEGSALTLESIFHAVVEALARDGKPVPTRRATGQKTRIVFARNAAAILPVPTRPVIAIGFPRSRPGHSRLPSQDPSPATRAPSSKDDAPETGATELQEMRQGLHAEPLFTGGDDNARTTEDNAATSGDNNEDQAKTAQPPDARQGSSNTMTIDPRDPLNLMRPLTQGQRPASAFSDEASAGRGGTEDTELIPPTAPSGVTNLEVVAVAPAESEKGEPAATDPHHPVDTKESHLNAKQDFILMTFVALAIFLSFVLIFLARASVIELTLSSVTGGVKPRAVKSEGQINALDYRLSRDAPIASDFTVPAMDDPSIVLIDSERGKRYLGAVITFVPDKPCAADATLTWTWTGVAHSDHAQRKMKLSQKAVLAFMELSGKTLRFSATISSSAPCAGSLKLVDAHIRNSDFGSDKGSSGFSHVKIEAQKT